MASLQSMTASDGPAVPNSRTCTAPVTMRQCRGRAARPPPSPPSHTEWMPAFPRRRVLDRVDAVVLSHADLGHLGALTYLVSRWGGQNAQGGGTRGGAEGGQKGNRVGEAGRFADSLSPGDISPYKLAITFSIPLTVSSLSLPLSPSLHTVSDCPSLLPAVQVWTVCPRVQHPACPAHGGAVHDRGADGQAGGEGVRGEEGLAMLWEPPCRTC